MDGHGILINALLYLAAAVIMVPLFVRLGLGSVLGYLAAGMIIGPWGLGAISHVEDVLHFAEFGVVLLLFLIGLELDPRKLWTLRKPILGAGGLQVGLTALAIFGIAIALGQSWQVSLVAGMGLALSSTAIALQILNEKNLLPTPAGQTSFSILLFQDIAVIPMIALLPLLGTVETGDGGNPWLAALRAVAVIVAIVVVGRFVIRYAFKVVVNTKLREVFTAFSLLLVVGIAALMNAVGLSMALGSFLAGVLLANSEYRHALESDIEPFKGLLLGLFFISVGMSMDFGLLLENPLLIVGLMLALVTTKLIVLYIVSMVADVPTHQRPMFAIVLSQGGEFAFVLFSAAAATGALPGQLAAPLVLAVALSMITTPLLLILSDRLLNKSIDAHVDMEMESMEGEDNPVIIIGFGRFGQVIGRMLHANGIKTTIVDHNPDHIDFIKRFGYKTYYGDALRIDLLKTAGADKAQLIVLAIDDRETINRAAELMKQEFPNTRVFARAVDRSHAMDLMELGVRDFTRETFYSAMEMGINALQVMGLGAHEARKAANVYKKSDWKTMDEQILVRHDQEKLISVSRQARERLEQTLGIENKDKVEKDRHDGSWGTV